MQARTTAVRVRFIAVRVRLIAVRVRFKRDNGYEWFRRQGPRANAMTGANHRGSGVEPIAIRSFRALLRAGSDLAGRPRRPGAGSAVRAAHLPRAAAGASTEPSWRGYGTIPSSAEKKGLAHARASDPYIGYESSLRGGRRGQFARMARVRVPCSYARTARQPEPLADASAPAREGGRKEA